MRVRPITTVGVLALGLGVLGGAPASAAGSSVTTTDDTVTCDATTCSLRGAVNAANADGGGTITLAPGVTYTLALAGADEDAGLTGDLDITSPITIIGKGATIDGGGLDRVLDVLGGGSLTASDLTITGGDTTNTATGADTPTNILSHSGAGIRTVGATTLTGVTLRGNTAAGTGASGGAIYNNGGTVRVTTATIDANSAVRAGGGIEVSTGDTVLDRVTLSGNTAGPTPGNGGGLHVTGAATTTVQGSTVSGNTAASEGGGLWNSATGTMTVTGTRVLGNEAKAATADGTQGGGGIFSDGGQTTVRFSQVADNKATGTDGSGGGIQSFGPLLVEGSLLNGNTSVRAGGAIEARNVVAAGGGVTPADTTIRFSAFSFNSTGANPGNGGAFHLTGAGTTTVSSSLAFSNSAANEGGAFWNSAAGTMTINGSFVAFNRAPDGPNVYNDGGTLTFNGRDIADGTGV
ncbi:hypothetical protein GCM10027047_38000 [Rhodococcus aerolatus]